MCFLHLRIGFPVDVNVDGFGSVVWSASENGRSGAHGARDDTSPRKHGFCSSMHLSHGFDLALTVGS